MPNTLNVPLNVSQLPSGKRDAAGQQATAEEERQLLTQRQLALQAQVNEAQARAKVLPSCPWCCSHRPIPDHHSYLHLTPLKLQ